MKIQVILQPCPWCKKTPELMLPTSDTENSGETWLWRVQCQNRCCTIKPVSPYVPVRKTTKVSAQMMARKLGQLADKWNQGNDYPAFEMKVIDVTQLRNMARSSEVVIILGS